MEPSRTLRAVAEVEVPVAVKLAETEMSLEDILSLRPGSTVSFPQRLDEGIYLEVDSVTVAEGYAVERAGRLGFRVRTLIDGARRAAPLG